MQKESPLFFSFPSASTMQRCPGIVEHLDLQDIASFLNVTPKTISKIRKEITFTNK